MKNVVILGSSPAGIKAAEEIRKTDPSAEISVFCEGNTFPFDRDLLGKFLAGEAKEEEILYRPKEFYKDQNINVVLGRKIQRVDFKKNRLITEEKEQVLFDVLIVTDVPMIRLTEMKGAQKMGVFHLRRLSDIKDLLSVLHLVDAVAVAADGFLALKTVLGLRKKKKEVLWVLPASYPLSEIIGQDAADLIVKELEANGIRIICGNAIAEILGEGDVKAVRLKTGKVIAVQAVVAGGALPDLKLFADTALAPETGLVTNHDFKTNLNHVFALDHVCQIKGEEFRPREDVFLETLEAQGQTAGKAVCGETVACEEPAFSQVVTVFGLDCVFAGKVRPDNETKEYLKTDPAAKLYRKILVKDNRVVGAVFFNCPSEKEQILGYVRNRQDITALDPAFLGEEAGVRVVGQNGSLAQVNAEASTDGQ